MLEGPSAPGFPHPVALISLQNLAIMSGDHPLEAAAGLEEVSAAESVPAALRDVAKKILQGVDKKAAAAAPVLALEAISVLPTYMGAVDFDGNMMAMKHALQAATYWDAAGFTSAEYFKPPQQH